MTNHEFYKTISQMTGIAQVDIQAIIRAMADVVYKTLCDDRTAKISLGNLGFFKVKHASQRRTVSSLGDNKGTYYIVPAHDEVQFIPFRAHKWLPGSGYDPIDPVIQREDELEEMDE